MNEYWPGARKTKWKSRLRPTKTGFIQISLNRSQLACPTVTLGGSKTMINTNLKRDTIRPNELAANKLRSVASSCIGNRHNHYFTHARPRSKRPREGDIAGNLASN